jgi:heme exporter protein C
MSLSDSDRKGFFVGAGLLAALLAVWVVALVFMPADEQQGEVYRIIYLHVPSAITAFFAAYALLWQSIQGLRKKDERYTNQGRACAEIGLLYTVITLATGSIWGRPTWGIWWTWDARLTTTFILALLYAGYLLLWNALPAGTQRTKACSVLGFLIAADIPIIYKSVTWWRTIHQPYSILREGGSTLDPSMLQLILTGAALMIATSLWLIRERSINLALANEIEQASYEKLKQQEVT